MYDYLLCPSNDSKDKADAPGSTNLIIILGMMQVSKKIPFDDPQVLMGVRGLYILSNLIIAGIYLYVQTKINAKKGTATAASKASIYRHKS